MKPAAKRPPSLVEFTRQQPALRWVVGAILLFALGACSQTEDSQRASATDSSPDAGRKLERGELTGEQLFSLPFPNADNERSCATCHVPEDHFTLTPAHVQRLWEQNPDDPLFSAIDADDPTADPLTFEHLKKGLVRVWLSIPDNVDLIDDAGSVVTPPDRKLFVWRGVPSIEDAVLSAPYQLDGRVATLEEQVQGAITGHSEGKAAPKYEIERIAAFERTVFSSDRARTVALELASGVEFDAASDVEDALELSVKEKRGRDVYDKVCANCHGGANQATIVDRELHDLAFPVIKPDGNVRYEVPATQPPTLVLAEQPANEFINIGTAFEMFLAFLGATEHRSFTQEVGFPAYRYRFYTDATRKTVAADLPPALQSFGAPPTGDGSDDEQGSSGDGGVGADAGVGGGGGFAIEVDSDGNPILGPNFAPQFFSTDPGRAMITGSVHDFEAFDVPTLRGIGKTPPYFHNNTAETLEDVVSLYSDHLFSRFPSLIQPGEKETDVDGDIGPEEALTAEMKSDLVAFLKRL